MNNRTRGWRHAVIAVPLALLCLPGCGSDDKNDDRNDDRQPDLPAAKFEPGPCPTNRIDPEVEEVLKNARCGTLVVPTSRTDPSKGTVRNAVAIVPAVAKDPAADPILWVDGGPGASAISRAPDLVTAGLNRDRDLILMSQRGNIHSEPSLTCVEIDRFNAEAISKGTDGPEAEKLRGKAVSECRDRLVKAGVDLSAFNTTESAADLDDLRTALDIPKWNVIGHSYGSQIARTYMQKYPYAIRSVVLDGIVPANAVSFGLLWRATGEGFNNLVKACAAQPDCNAAYPDLGGKFNRVVGEAAEKPTTTTVTLDDGEQVRVVIDVSTLVSWLVYASHTAPDAPAVIHALAQGDPQPFAEQWAPRVSPEGFEIFSWGLLNSVTCAEWERGEEEEIREGREAFPEFPSSAWQNVPQVPFHHRVDCGIWDVPAAPDSLRDPAKSDVPTLVLSGSFDAQTAAGNGEIVAETLTNAVVETIPYAAHMTFYDSACSADLIVAFTDNPDPVALDASCIDQIEPPKFNVK